MSEPNILYAPAPPNRIGTKVLCDVPIDDYNVNFVDNHVYSYDTIKNIPTKCQNHQEYVQPRYKPFDPYWNPFQRQKKVIEGFYNYPCGYGYGSLLNLSISLICLFIIIYLLYAIFNPRPVVY